MCEVACEKNQGPQEVGDAHFRIFANTGEAVSVLYRVSNFSAKNWPMRLGVIPVCKDWPVEMKNPKSFKVNANHYALVTLKLVIPPTISAN